MSLQPPSAHQIFQALRQGQPIPGTPAFSESEGQQIQLTLARLFNHHEDPIKGFKVGLVNELDQASFETRSPGVGVMPASRIVSQGPVIISSNHDTWVEAELVLRCALPALPKNLPATEIAQHFVVVGIGFEFVSSKWQQPAAKTKGNWLAENGMFEMAYVQEISAPIPVNEIINKEHGVTWRIAANSDTHVTDVSYLPAALQALHHCGSLASGTANFDYIVFSGSLIPPQPLPASGAVTAAVHVPGIGQAFTTVVKVPDRSAPTS